MGHLERLQQEVAGHLRLLPADSREKPVTGTGRVSGLDALVQTVGSQAAQTVGTVRALKVVEEGTPGIGVPFHVWAQSVIGKKDPASGRTSLLEQLHREGH